MSLNIDHIQKLADSSGITREFVEAVLLDPESIRNVRHKHNVGKPWGTWEKVAEIFDNHAPDMDHLHKVHYGNSIYISNLAFIIPRQFQINCSSFVGALNAANSSQIATVLSYEMNACEVVKCLSELKGITARFAILLALSAKKFESVFYSFGCDSFEQFMWMLSEKIEGGDPGESAAQEFINRSYNAHLRRKFVQKDEKSLPRKIALFVTGQHRSSDENLRKLSTLFEKSCEVDVYFSSWVHRAPFSIRTEQLSRIMDREAIDWLLENQIDFDESLTARLTEHFSSEQDTIKSSEIKQAFFWANNIHINLEEDFSEKFSLMSNAEKMYYHNSYWFQKLSDSHFESYDLIVKVRPDVEFVSFDLRKISEALDSSNFISEDHFGWIFRNWGFGVGDQVLVGAPSVMCGLMNLHSTIESQLPDLTTRVLSDTLGFSRYMGHSNIGLKAVERGVEVLPNSYFNIRFSPFRRITKRKVMEAMCAL